MKKFLLYFTLTLVVIFIVTLFIGFFEENGEGMDPTIKDGATSIVFKPVFFTPEYETGDVVVYNQEPGWQYVGRILAVPGEKVRIHEGKLYKEINGQIQELEESSYNRAPRIPIRTDKDGEWITLNGYLIFLDKFRSNQNFDEHIISPENIVGKIYFVFQ